MAVDSPKVGDRIRYKHSEYDEYTQDFEILAMGVNKCLLKTTKEKDKNRYSALEDSLYQVSYNGSDCGNASYVGYNINTLEEVGEWSKLSKSVKSTKISRTFYKDKILKDNGETLEVSCE